VGLANSDGDTGTDRRTEGWGWPGQDSGYLPTVAGLPKCSPPASAATKAAEPTAPLPIDDAAQHVNMRTDSTLNPAQ
jgi:hypothetical protein